MTKLPLEGIRIIGNTVVWAGPYAEMLLADWGAEVIRIESISHFPSTTRGMMAHPADAIAKMNNPVMSYPDSEPGKRPWNRCSLFNSHARNKMSMTIDLTKPRGKEIYKRLVGLSDIIIENNVLNTMEKLDLGYDELKKMNPKIIMISLTSYGRSGPYKNFRSMAAQLEAFLGHTMLRGYPCLDTRSTPSVYHSDAVAGAMAAFAVMMALHERRNTGKGQFIELAIGEATMCQLADAIMTYTMNGLVQKPIGNRHPVYAPCGCYLCKGEDKWVNITVTSEDEWRGLCQAMGNPAWCNEKRFKNESSRYINQDQLDELITQWTSKHNHYEVMHLLQSKGVPAGAVLDEKEIFADPHIIKRGFFEDCSQKDCGTHKYPGLMWRMSNVPNKIRKPPVRLGEDNEYIYKKIIGVSDKEFEELKAEGHIGMDYMPNIP